MAGWGSADADQLRALQQRLQEFGQVDSALICRECAKELAARLLRKVRKRTPVGQYGEGTGMTGGTLRRSWMIGGINQSGNTYTIEVMNPMQYASYVEYGHRQLPGRYVPAIGKRLKKSWVNGKFMLTISEKEITNIAPKLLEKRLQKKLGELFG